MRSLISRGKYTSKGKWCILKEVYSWSFSSSLKFLGFYVYMSSILHFHNSCFITVFMSHSMSHAIVVEIPRMFYATDCISVLWLTSLNFGGKGEEKKKNGMDRKCECSHFPLFYHLIFIILYIILGPCWFFLFLFFQYVVL